ncbi:matrixin family metalloprotease [Winogradskyella forsetii]|uniref:matrixin family metalloprotease n=1 Tax=Winogradskyella forsetii TaxID=2686077 RepID=UPI0015CC9A4E|nr:matrixin family metalloprotease [Winogradskyella forsetii]
MKIKYILLISLLVIIAISIFFLFRKNKADPNNLIYVEPYLNISLDSLEYNKSFANGIPRPDLLNRFEDFKSEFDTIRYGTKVFYLVEGDIRYDEDELLRYYLRNDSILNPSIDDNLNQIKLVIGLNSDEFLDIMPNPEELTYAIFKESFPFDIQYEAVKKNFKEATTQWANILDNKVQLRHIEHFDIKKNQDTIQKNVSFIIRYSESSMDSEGKAKFVASAFFPSTNKEDWNVEVTPGYFTTDFDKVGLFRHEIGHILGFRHEHNRDSSPAACRPCRSCDDCNDCQKCILCKEQKKKIIPLTKYDSVSLMHYYCGGYGNKKLTFSKKDIEGAKCIYINNLSCINDLDI